LTLNLIMSIPNTAECDASVVQQSSSPHGPFHFVPSCAFFPLLLPFHLSLPSPPLVHARATATTATRGCASSAGGYSWSYSSLEEEEDPSHGDNGNAWLRFFTAGSGGGTAGSGGGLVMAVGL
jgi:hypothetical protein